MAYNPIKDEKKLRGFPNPLAPESEKKSEAYGLQYAKKIWDEAQGKSRSFYRQRERIVELRNYAVDTMSIDKFKDKYAIDNGNTSYLNLNFNMGTVVPNYVNISSNKLIDRGYEINLESIDKDSTSEFDKELKRRIGEIRLRKAALKAAEKQGMNPTIEKVLADTEDANESIDEATFDMEMNFKTEAEESYEAGIDFVWLNNRMKEVEKVIARDLHVVQRAGTMTFLDGNGDIKVDWVDQKNFVSGYCTHPDYSDCRYLGVVREMTLAQLRELAGDKFIDEQYYNMARQWTAELGNDRFTLGSYHDNTYTFSEFSDFKILVLFFQYKAVDKRKYRKKVKRGVSYYDAVDDTYEMDYEDKNGQKKRKKGVERVDSIDEVNIYQGYHVVNTDYIFNYEKKPNMTRRIEDGTYSTDTDFDIIMYAPQMQDMSTKSMVERMLPHVEAMIETDLKIQHFVAKSRPAGVALDVAALQGITTGIGGKFVTYDMAQKIYDQVGNLYYNSMRADGTPAIAANSTPIQDLPNGLARGLQELLALQNYHLSQIYQITGLNPAVDGTMPSKGTLVGTIQAQEMSYNSAVKHLFDAYVDIMQRTADRIVLLMQSQMDMGVKVRGYKKGIGGARTMVIKATKNIRMAQLGIKVEFKPTAGDKQDIKDYLAHALKSDQISVGDAMRAEEMLEVSPKEASEYITRKVESYAKMKSDIQMQQQQAAAQAAQAQEQAKAQSEIAAANAKAEAKIAEIQAEYDRKEALAILEHNLRLEMADEDTENKKELIRESENAQEDSGSDKGEGFKLRDTTRKMKENVAGVGVSRPRVGQSPQNDTQNNLAASMR